MAPDDALLSIPPVCYGVPLVAGTGCLACSLPYRDEGEGPGALGRGRNY
jgi:hypothetical protein